MNSTWGQAFLENAEKKLKSGSTYFAGAVVALGTIWSQIPDATQTSILAGVGVKGSTVLIGIAVAYFVTLFKPVAKPLPVDLTTTLDKLVQQALKDRGLAVAAPVAVAVVPAERAVATSVDLDPTKPMPIGIVARTAPDGPTIDPMLVDLYRQAKAIEPPATDDAIFQTYQLWKGKV